MAWQSRLVCLPWKVPSIIILSFIGATLLAIGHHLFYQSLDGSLVRQAAFNQQFNVGIGTAFAFLVRALLVLSMGTTYWQLFWRTLSSETLTVSNIDTLFSFLDNVFAFAKVPSIIRHPLLVAIALLSWTVPIAIIVPPATLSVRSHTVESHEFKTMHVPFFDTSNMAQTSRSTGYEPDAISEGSSSSSSSYDCESSGNYLLYNGPSQPLSRMTLATAYQGDLPNIHVPKINASYALSFNAPAVRCENASARVLSELGLGRPTNDYTYEYLSWAPSYSSLVPPNVRGKAPSFDKEVKFNQISGITVNGSSDGFSSYLGQHKHLPPSLLFAYVHYPPPQSYKTWSALNCSFYNATYTVHFSFPNGRQEINVQSVELLENSLRLSVPIKNDCKHGSETGTILTGEQVGYQGLIEALGRALVGTMSFANGILQTNKLVVEQTSVLKTNLAYSNELAWLYGMGQKVGNLNSFNTDLINGSRKLSSVPYTGLPLATAIEHLFRNMTLSLFAEKSMLVSSPSETNMTIAVAENIYSYDWTQLVLAYGVAILVTLFTVVVGLIVLVANGAAYSSDFSTFMRLVRGQHIDDAVAAYDDRHGADPLPKALAQARIQIGSGPDQRHSVLIGRRTSGKRGAAEHAEVRETLNDVSDSISQVDSLQ